MTAGVMKKLWKTLILPKTTYGIHFVPLNPELIDKWNS